MAPSEFVKINAKTGESRIEILKRKIRNNEPLELEAGGVILVTDTIGAIKELDNLDKINPKSFNIVGDINGKQVTILSSKLKKSADLGGGGGGTRGGSQIADMSESAQCYFCSAVCNVLNSGSDPDNLTDSVLRAGAMHVEAPMTVDEVIANISKEWRETSANIAVSLFNDGYIKKGMRFYRKKGIFKKVYDNARKSMIASELVMPNDKWNPGDIWAAVATFNPDDMITSSIAAYNQDILRLFNNRELVGISLKKTGKTINIDTYNLTSEKPSYHPISYNVTDGQKSSFDSTTKVILKFNNGEAEGRTFNTFNNWSFELKGKFAAGGKCGLGPVLSILRFNNVEPPMLNYASIKKLVMNIDESFLNEMFLLYQKFDVQHVFDKDSFNKMILDKGSSTQGQNWIFSKYIGMKIFESIVNTSDVNEDAIVNDIILYASSSSQFSSVYIKVY